MPVVSVSILPRLACAAISRKLLACVPVLLNQLDRAQGWVDSPLTASGKQAAKELGKALSSIMFQAVYTSDTYRAFHTARLVVEENNQPDIPIHQETRLREWCLGIMEAEQNSIFIKSVSEWLGGVSFFEMNKRLPEVAAAIKQHDTTGMAESFEQICERLKSFFLSAGWALCPAWSQVSGRGCTTASGQSQLPSPTKSFARARKPWGGTPVSSPPHTR